MVHERRYFVTGGITRVQRYTTSDIIDTEPLFETLTKKEIASLSPTWKRKSRKHRLVSIGNFIVTMFLEIVIEHVLKGDLVDMLQDRKAYIGRMRLDFPSELQRKRDKMLEHRNPKYGLKFTNFNMGLYNFKMAKKYRQQLAKNINGGQVYYD